MWHFQCERRPPTKKRQEVYLHFGVYLSDACSKSKRHLISLEEVSPFCKAGKDHPDFGGWTSRGEGLAKKKEEKNINRM